MARVNLIQLRGGTAAAWTSANPVLELREPGVETDTRRFKFGDGVTAWNSLPYASANSHFLGVYVDEAALISAHATAEPGDYAYVDAGVANPTELWLWDDDDEEWVQTGSAALPTAAQVAFTPAGNIAATDVQAAIEELDSETLVGRASANTTGTAVSFAVPQTYGTPGSPETGNITLVTTGLVQGMVQTMYHQNGTEPTYPAEFIRLGSGTYSTAVRNIIFMHAVSTTRIEYVVTQEQ
jgi:hypothetical protein